jgi:hypothetical protein
MNQSHDWLRRLNPPRRNHFFTGKMMGVAQFEREQRYDMGQRWLMNRLTLGTGILCGLEVSVVDGNRIRVERGVAIDPWGREIVVARAVEEYDPFKTGGRDCGGGEGPSISEAGDYILCLTYRECTADEQAVQYAEDCSTQSDCQPDTTVETFALSVRLAQEASDGFDCRKWMLPARSATTAAPAVLPPVSRTRPGVVDVQPEIGSHPLPGAAAPGIRSPAQPTSTPETPPSIAALRERLREQLGTSRGQIPGDACVPLGRITVTKAKDGTWALLPDVSKEPRVEIYSQAQLLEMILCLTKCCASHEPPIAPPIAGDTLRVKSVELVARRQDGNYVTIDPDPTASGRKYSWPPSARLEINPMWAGLQITFTQPVDSTSLPLASSHSAIIIPSVKLVRSRVGRAEQSFTLSGLLLEPNVILLSPMSSNPALVQTLADAGLYTLTLYGSDSPDEHQSVRSWASDPGKRRLLDGEFVDRKFPSGEDHDGGDFIFEFEIAEIAEDTLQLVGVTVDRIQLGAGVDLSVKWSDNGVPIELTFNKAVSPESLAKGVTVTTPIRGTTAAFKGITMVSEDRQYVLTFSVPPPGGGSYDATFRLSGAVIKGSDGGQFNGTDANKPQSLPSGGVPGGDFWFKVQITA